MVEINTNSYKGYQSWFSDRMVSANKYGVPDVKEEIEEIEKDIQEVPWESLDEEERVSIANVAIRAVETIFAQAAYDGQITDRTVQKIMSQFSMLLFNKITLTEDPFDGAGLGLVKMNIEEDL